MNLTYILFLVFLSLLDFCFTTDFETKKEIKGDLRKLNATCHLDKNCNEYNVAGDCDCESSCSQQGTCCADSFYVSMTAPTVRPSCLSDSVMSRSDSGILMIDRCPPNGPAESASDEMCRREESDWTWYVPVTSLFTHRIYKNYFCYLCNERSDDYVFWDVQLTYYGQSNVQYNDPSVQRVKYDKYNHTWVAPLVEGGKYVPVTLEYVQPQTIDVNPKFCTLGLISECSADWPNEDVRLKCDTYLQPTRIERENAALMYKNPHCALCNYENLQDKRCGAFDAEKRSSFSFALLLDINRSDVGKVQRCADGKMWDPFFEKCRTLRCAFPGYVLRDGKCVKA